MESRPEKMKMKDEKRVASDRQEMIVANFLGFKKVVASGARNFYPGDVESEQWLGECKTKLTPHDNISIIHRHWRKIQDEADGKHKFPVLFVDNGTQTASNTWAIVRSNVLPLDIDVKQADMFKDNKSSTTFSHLLAKEQYKLCNRQGLNYVFTGQDTHMVVIPLTKFKELVEVM